MSAGLLIGLPQDPNIDPTHVSLAVSRVRDSPRLVHIETFRNDHRDHIGGYVEPPGHVGDIVPSPKPWQIMGGSVARLQRGIKLLPIADESQTHL